MSTTHPVRPFTSLDDLLGALDGIVRIDAGGGRLEQESRSSMPPDFATG